MESFCQRINFIIGFVVIGVIQAHAAAFRRIGDIVDHQILQCLQKRGLISIDYDLPLKGFAGRTYEVYPIRGSFALTARGQRVVELLEMQGIG